MSNVLQISDSIFRNLGDPFSLSITIISYWLRYSGMGKLNTKLDLSIALDSSLNFTPELAADEAAILEELYYINYYDKAANNALGANSYDISDTWTEIKEGDQSVKRINRVEIAKQYIALKNKHEEELDSLVTLYRMNKSIPKEERYY